MSDDFEDELDADAPRTDRRGRLLHIPTPGPVRLLGRARRAAETLPFAGEAFKRLRETEDWAVAELKHRMDAIGESAARFVGDAAPGSAAQHLAELLQAAKQNSALQARERLYVQVLDQMVPEQACMLAVLAQDRPTVMCHVDAGAPVGPVSRRVLAYANSAGKEAGLVLRDTVPRLMAQMVALGLIEEMPEQKSLKAHYEMLETEDCVRRAVVHIKDDLRLWPRIQRRSLRLSEFGAALWQDAGPQLGGAPPSQ